jgi:hypothetical protein
MLSVLSRRLLARRLPLPFRAPHLCASLSATASNPASRTVIEDDENDDELEEIEPATESTAKPDEAKTRPKRPKQLE